jgi:hypothetical protein
VFDYASYFELVNFIMVIETVCLIMILIDIWCIDVIDVVCEMYVFVSWHG